MAVENDPRNVLTHRIVVLAVAFLLIALAGCNSDGSQDATTAPQLDSTAIPSTTVETPDTTEGNTGSPSGDPIRIGVSLTLTGIFAEFGAANQNGYEMCVEEINNAGGLLDRPVEIVIEDNRSDTEVAVNQYERFINVDNVDLLFGPFSSLLYFPTSSVAEQAGMVFPAPAGGALEIWERGYQNIFYFQQDPGEYVGEAPLNALQYYRDIGLISEDEYPETVAVVAVDDFFVNAIVTGLLEEPGFVAEAGLEVVLNETFPVGFTDWLSLANQIASSEADIVLGGLTAGDEAIELMRALDTVGYQPKMIYLSEAASSEFADNLGAIAEGVIAHTSWHPAVEFGGRLAGEPFTNEDFTSRFEEAYGHAPGENEAQAFAVCQGIEQAVRGTGTLDNGEIRDWLRERTADDSVQTVMGDFHWDDRGLPVDRDFLVGQWQNGSLEFIYPAEEFPNVSEMAYPIPPQQ